MGSTGNDRHSGVWPTSCPAVGRRRRTAATERDGSGRNDGPSVGRRHVLLVAAATVTAGCLSSDDGDSPSNATNRSDGTDGPDGTDGSDGGDDGDAPETDRPSSIDANLYGLTTTDDVEAYAARYDYAVRDGRVEVVVDLAPNRTAPRHPEITDADRYGGRVVGSVAIDELDALARHENVTHVGTPDVAREAE